MVGYYRCAIRSCSSRVNQGLKFRKFPRDIKIAKKWLLKLGNDFTIDATTYLCQRHFDAHQFEKVREDGQMKFRHDAVPSLFLPPLTASENMTRKEVRQNALRSPLGDISNQQTPQAQSKVSHFESFKSWDHAYARTPPEVPTAPPWQPMDETLTDTGDCESPSVGRVQFFTDFSEVDMSTVVECSVIHDPQIIFEETSVTLSDGGSADLHISQASKETNLETLYAGENVDSDSTMVSKEKNLLHPSGVQNVDGLDASILSEANKLHDIAETQRAEIVMLRSMINDQDKVAALLEETNKKYEELQKKHKNLQEVNYRLQKQVERSTNSPWLSKAQQEILHRGSTRGHKWNDNLILKGLVLKMKCGTTGYSAFVKELPFFPSVRTLQESVQFVRFESGILEEMVDLLADAVKKHMRDYETDCLVVLDEMAIKPDERLDKSTGKWVGASTFPSHDGKATKALLFMLVGVSTRWKMPVAVYLTNSKAKSQQDVQNATGEAYKNILDEVILRAENIGLKVCGITSDMGPENLSFWRAYGITGTRKGATVCSFDNPVRKGEVIYVMPDSIHLFKAIKSMMENNTVIQLPASIVEREGLPSSEINYNHVQDLYEFEEDCELKVAFRLKPSNIKVKKHFARMDVANYRAVLCNRTKVGLELMAEEKNEDNYKTTAWFFDLLNTLFELITNRHVSMALSRKNKGAYNKAINFLKKVRDVFKTMTVGYKGEWKPCQRGLLVLIDSLLGLQEYFLQKRGYKYLLLGRFTSDCIENVFSMIRLSQPIPHAIAFFQNLKVITLAQLSEVVKKSSYDHDETESLPGVDFLQEARNKAKDRQAMKFFASLDELYAHPVEKVTQEECSAIRQWEQAVIYDMAGSVVRGLKTGNITICQTCLKALLWQEEGRLHSLSFVSEAKEFLTLKSDERAGELLQFYVSHEVFKAILWAEVTLRKYRDLTKRFKSLDVEKYFVDNLMYVWDGTAIPDCHDIKRKMLQIYVRYRLQQYAAKMRQETVQKSSIDRSSKSIAYRDAISNMSLSSRK